jgi:hypothetical protein
VLQELEAGFEAFETYFKSSGTVPCNNHDIVLGADLGMHLRTHNIHGSFSQLLLHLTVHAVVRQCAQRCARSEREI